MARKPTNPELESIIKSLGKTKRLPNWSKERYINKIMEEILESKVLEINTKIYLNRNNIKNSESWWEDCLFFPLYSFFKSPKTPDLIIGMWERKPKELISYLCKVIILQSFANTPVSFKNKHINKPFIINYENYINKGVMNDEEDEYSEPIDMENIADINNFFEAEENIDEYYNKVFK